MCALTADPAPLWRLEAEPGFEHGSGIDVCAAHLGAALAHLRAVRPDAFIHLVPGVDDVCTFEGPAAPLDESLLGGGRGSGRDLFAELYHAVVAVVEDNPGNPLTSGLRALLEPLQADIAEYGSVEAALRPRRATELAFQHQLRAYRTGESLTDEEQHLVARRNRIVHPFKALHRVARHLLASSLDAPPAGAAHLSAAVEALDDCGDWGLTGLPGATVLPPSLQSLADRSSSDS